jgi:hypothetical protein
MHMAFCVMAGAASAAEFSAGPTFGVTCLGTMEPNLPVYGLQAQVRRESWLSLELAALRLTDQPEEERFGISATAKQDITPLLLSLRYGRPVMANRLEAYVLGGIGYYLVALTTVPHDLP